MKIYSMLFTVQWRMESGTELTLVLVRWSSVCLPNCHLPCLSLVRIQHCPGWPPTAIIGKLNMLYFSIFPPTSNFRPIKYLDFCYTLHLILGTYLFIGLSNLAVNSICTTILRKLKHILHALKPYVYSLSFQLIQPTTQIIGTHI